MLPAPAIVNPRTQRKVWSWRRINKSPTTWSDNMRLTTWSMSGKRDRKNKLPNFVGANIRPRLSVQRRAP